LIVGGKALMPLDSYPFSERYAWVEDKFGVSWQIILSKEAKSAVIPSFLFTQGNVGRAEEAINFYTYIFKDSKIGMISRYGKGQEPEKEGNVNYASFFLENQEFSAMESAGGHKFFFSEAVSLIVNCDDQEEIDYYWSKLSAVAESEQCGWLKDKFGVSWQITPKVLGEMMSKGSPAQVDRVTQAFLKMKKFDISKLEEAYNSK
jgi:predicted 3-demethylubiquinone-9 3-methyltransferase (glyoxalase superfamily)